MATEALRATIRLPYSRVSQVLVEQDTRQFLQVIRQILYVDPWFLGIINKAFLKPAKTMLQMSVSVPLISRKVGKGYQELPTWIK